MSCTNLHIPSRAILRYRYFICSIVAVVFACFLVAPSFAVADVQQNDVIGTRTIKEQGLTIGQAPDVDAHYGMLVTSDGKMLWSRGMDEHSKIASVTKIMTAVVALENAALTDTFTIPKEAVEVGESSANLTEGSKATFSNLLKGLLVESGNDAAVTLAIGIAGSESAFADMMNDKAAELGMTNTVYRNPHGLDDGKYAGDQHSSAADMVKLIDYAMQKQEFRDVVCLYETTVDLGNGESTVTNTNDLLAEYEYCIGIKTGFTDEAGYCLASAANRKDIELYAIVLGSSAYSTRFSASENLYDWGYKHYRYFVLNDTTTTIANVPALAWMDKSIPVTCATEEQALLFNLDGPITQDITVNNVKGAVKKGAALGSISWMQNGSVIATSKLIATEDCPAPGFFESIGIWFKRTFSDAPDAKELEVLVSAPELE